jgi:FixJ family two-component response regulator
MPMAPHTETVFIVDDDVSVRDSLALLLSLRGHPTASFAGAEDFLAALQPDWRGCVVVDIRMPGLSGLELQRRLHAARARLPVIVITAHGDMATVRQAFLADAVDFLEKPFDGDQLIAAVDTALTRLRRLPAPAPAGSASRAGIETLTPRERQVMDLLLAGMHNRGIADELGISPRTVEVHKARVMEKTGVASLVELVRIADQRHD